MKYSPRLGVSAVMFASLCSAAVDGTVQNRTTGKLQPGATVTLYKLGQAGMESLESVKSDAQGRFSIAQTANGPHLIQTAYDGVTYNHMLPPATPRTGLTLEVFNSSRQQGDAKIAQHMVLLEPSGDQLGVSESYVYRNDGRITYNDPDGGTLKFFVPAAARGTLRVNATAPQGMPIERAAEPAGGADTYKIDFPIKPGETRIDLTYSVPFTAPGTFEGKVLHKEGATYLIAPAGVTIKGEGLDSGRQEPRSRATIYELSRADYKVEIDGSGSLRGMGAEESAGPSVEQILPRVYRNMYWILGLAFAILALGFTLLYRAPSPSAGKAGHGRGSH
ncbi:MAG: carboxypeptidase-like regulatory domain-containing protein [Bryobacteraceae bacterium]